MSKKAKPARDAFTFSLGGMSTKSPFVVLPAIAHDAMNKALDEKRSQSQEDQPDTAEEIGTFWGRFWLHKRRRPAAYGHERPEHQQEPGLCPALLYSAAIFRL